MQPAAGNYDWQSSLPLTRRQSADFQATAENVCWSWYVPHEAVILSHQSFLTWKAMQERCSVSHSICRSICLSFYPSIYRSIYLFSYPSVCLSVYLSIYLSIQYIYIYISACVYTYTHNKRRPPLPPPIIHLPDDFIISRVRFLSECPQNHLRSIQRRSPAPGATHSATSLRETTASMRSVFVITCSTSFYKSKISLKRIKNKQNFKHINENPSSSDHPFY